MLGLRRFHTNCIESFRLRRSTVRSERSNLLTDALMLDPAQSGSIAATSMDTAKKEMSRERDGSYTMSTDRNDVADREIWQSPGPSQVFALPMIVLAKRIDAGVVYVCHQLSSLSFAGAKKLKACGITSMCMGVVPNASPSIMAMTSRSVLRGRRDFCLRKLHICRPTRCR